MAYTPKYQAAADKFWKESCYHCGDLCDLETVLFEDKAFLLPWV